MSDSDTETGPTPMASLASSSGNEGSTGPPNSGESGVKLAFGAVAILDRLGTRGIWARSDPDTVVRSWESVIGFFSEAVAQHEQSDTNWGPMGRPTAHVAAFSDTIILTLQGEDPPRYLPTLFSLRGVPFTRALVQGVFLRGVFSIGQFYRTESLVIGPAVDEAADWYEQPDWMGVSAAPSAAFGLERLIEQGGTVDEWFARYDIPLKAGSYRNGWAVAWPNLMTDRPLPDRVISDRGMLMQIFSQNPIGVAVLSKYENTIAFLDHVLGLKEANGPSETSAGQ